MITIIVGTNRHNSVSKKVGIHYQKLLNSLGQESQIIDLAELPYDFTFSALYHNSGKNEAFNVFQRIIDSSQKFVFIVPEYNGSFPGVLKTFFDGLRYPDSFNDKKAALVGISAGVLGNAVGLSHLNDILSYMGTDVMGLRMKFGNMKNHFDGEEFTFDIYKNLLEKQARALIAF
ncbi:NADPH-dependent FMN reductase [Emticicia oligotrophica DSM 17448]|uniref:NADPH-dependent FMN reductase n=1 Tax=Emticicia oligotrophica (strain DSM 17448 / CIP 109782 / MTCC 6937 / GPTSA100-15) TaxID=929562 RepID=A0ABN4AJT5_EMTOG|nr:NAD(P)H-dependent oxidoreductase [Emticicia oligotrophica]AFK02419.1 NADPH-dependent FMN reductase [Emticicia oligotrophica DSM 17448]